MTANQYISLALLIGRLIALYIMFFVVRRQYRNLKAKSYPELHELRRNLLVASFVTLSSYVIPITIDVLGILNIGSFGLLLAYVFSNNISALLSATILWYNLELTQRIKLIDQAAIKEELGKLAKSKSKNVKLQTMLDDKQV